MWKFSRRDLDVLIANSATGRIIVYLATILAIMVIPVLVISRVKALTAHTYLFDIVFEGIFAAAAAGAIFLMRKGPNSRPVADYGIVSTGIVTQTAIGAGIGLAIMSTLINVLRAVHAYQIVGVNHHFMPLLAVVMFFFVAVAEETVFRGFIFNTLEKTTGTSVALVATSLGFGLAHLLDPLPDIAFGEHLRAALFIGLEVGLLLNASFLVTRSLWMNIGIHWAWNFFQGPFYGATVSGSPESSTFYIARFTGSSIVTGGAFGPEASIYCLVIGTIAGILMLIAAIRRGQWRMSPEHVDSEK